jgi:ABC-type phosphate/phosphonate transport system substrate-binding protein
MKHPLALVYASRVSAFAVLMVLALAAAGAPRARAAETPAEALRFGFFRSLFRDVRENDMRASLKVYTGALARDLTIHTHPESLVVSQSAEAEAALRRGGVDLLSGTAEEILSLPEELLTGPYLLGVSEGMPGVEYLLLVRRDSGWSRLQELGGRSLAIARTTQHSLALPWLDTLAHAECGAAPGRFFGAIQESAKPAQAVLRVFFRQAEAGVVTRAGFGLMAELNPQLAKELVVLTASPRLVPAFAVFRAGFDPAVRRKIAASMSGLADTPAGRQVLTLFQAVRIMAATEEDLVRTRQLLTDHSRLPGSAALPIARVSASP